MQATDLIEVIPPGKTKPILAHQALMIRDKTSDMGTFSTFSILDQVFQFIELPWRENRKSISHILPGTYLCTPYSSKKYSYVWLVNGTPGRDAVLIHCGNVAGDVLKGYLSHSWGCLLIGQRRTTMWNQWAVGDSSIAKKKLVALTNWQPILLTIGNAY